MTPAGWAVVLVAAALGLGGMIFDVLAVRKDGRR